MTFRVGQKVVCVKTESAENPPPYAVKGHVYTISEIMWQDEEVATNPGLSLQFEELSFGGNDEWLPGFRAELFRPIQTTDISIFRAMLVNPPREIVGA